MVKRIIKGDLIIVFFKPLPSDFAHLTNQLVMLVDMIKS